MSILGDNIREFRIKAGLTQNELAKKIDVSDITISRYENGRREPSLDTLFDISNALNVSVNKLVGMADPDDIPIEEYEDEIKWFESHENLFNGAFSFEKLSEEDIAKWEEYHQILLDSFFKLNIDGKGEAAKRVEELTHIERYTKKDSDSE